MRKKFDGLPSRVVKLSHGDQTIEIRCEALPAGYGQYIRQVLPRPERFRNGKTPLPLSPSESGLYNNRIGYLMLERGIREDACLETPIPAASAKGAVWADFADAVEREFAEAGFSEGDVSALSEAVQDLSASTTIKDSAGN